MDEYVDWVCPECGLTDRTKPLPANAQRMHICPKLRMLMTPMQPAGSSARIILRERDDYIGKEAVQLDPELGRPVMSMETHHADGRVDARVYAPVARGKRRS